MSFDVAGGAPLTTDHGPLTTLALFGGVYSNHVALAAAIDDALARGAERLYCLGDLGAFGPSPDKVFPLLREYDVVCLQGNYDDSIGNELADCQCGYTDPRDNHFAQLSYDYTLANTSRENRAFLRGLPTELRFEIDGVRFLLCHGSPRRVNEFLWESTTSTQFLEKLADDFEADVILGTHTGLHWHRELSGGRHFANVGVLGRPANDGTTNVWYTLARVEGRGSRDKGGDVVRISNPSERTTATEREHDHPRIEDPCHEEASRDPSPHDAGEEQGREPPSTLDPRPLTLDFVPVHYDHESLADEMRREDLPDEFIETILTGWWTTCLEVLPQRERRRGRF